MSILKGALGAFVGYVVGAGLVTAIRAVTGADPWDLEVATMGAYLPMLAGWLLGVGVWQYWARRWFGREVKPYTVTGWKRYFNFDGDHKVIGIQYLVTFLFMFFLAGLFAMVMRWELMNPGEDLLTASSYNGFMSLHGTMMVFVAVAATVGAFGNYVVPLMIGADDMAFPKLNALSYWIVPMVVVFLSASFLVGGFDTGWTGYAPLSEATKTGALVAWSRNDGDDYRMTISKFDGSKWYAPQTVGGRGAVDPQLTILDRKIYLLFNSASTASWSILELQPTGRVLRQASVAGPGDERPILTWTSSHQVGLRSASVRETTAQWEANR